MGKRGHYTVLEGLDGIGKGTVIAEIRRYLVNRGHRILDLERREFDRDFEREPVSEAESGLVLTVSEPTHSWVGAAIRKELIAKNGRDYSPMGIAKAYSLDRHMLLRRVILPAVGRGADVLSSRNFVSSLCYQVLGDIQQHGPHFTEPESVECAVSMIRGRVLDLAGNAFALAHPPDLIVISTIKSIDDLIARLASRVKQDNCKFENPEFQTALKPLYESSSLRILLENAGSRVAYLDAGISIESTREQAVEIYSDFYERGIIKPRYQNP